MKLIIQIAFGVFLGTVTAQITVDSWHQFQEKKEKEQAQKQLYQLEKARLEQADRIRAMFLERRKNQKLENSKSPAGFMPDDAQIMPTQDE